MCFGGPSTRLWQAEHYHIDRAICPALHEKFPKISEMGRFLESFPYRFEQKIWADLVPASPVTRDRSREANIQLG
jgi:hypothetical protein